MKTISIFKSTSKVIFIITEVTKLNLQAYSNKFFFIIWKYNKQMRMFKKGKSIELHNTQKN
jgi:hypothetical protein